ncbi:MAG: hypothetical protein AAF138_04435 [Planctomycetota bacterium]
MIFTGHAELTIDGQHRLQIPAKIRAAWNPELHGDHWICVPWPEDGGMLRLFPAKTFQKIAADRPQSLMTSGARGRLEAQLFGMAEPLRPDSANRVKLHPMHIRQVALPKDVVVLGVNDHIEVRNRDVWMKSMDDIFSNLPQLAEEIERANREAH